MFRTNTLAPILRHSILRTTQRKHTKPFTTTQVIMGVTNDTITPGNGVDFPKEGDKVSMYYVGKLKDGTVFDSTAKRGVFTTFIGVGQVIKGWDEGIPKMSLGEKAKLTISPDYGYGTVGFQNLIPPNSELIFEVELIQINEKRATPRPTATPTTAA
ncbi:hypothetical protein K440DRAFT_274922 [Wilcoxina mikolae CBS 423.85]|nr:hypothetical protein K440DRAFT_274922 [Wilcoxina mikolae CBS 423.85]